MVNCWIFHGEDMWSFLSKLENSTLVSYCIPWSQPLSEATQGFGWAPSKSSRIHPNGGIIHFSQSNTLKGSRKKEDQRKARTKSIQDKSFTKSTRLPKYNHYTPLNVNQARLLEEAFNAKNLSQPPLAILVNSTGRLKTCRYHQNFGHTTEECVTLKDKI